MNSKEHFEFNLGDEARLAVTGESGEVIGRADSKHDQNRFQLRYKDAQGCAQTKWFPADALVKT